MKSRFIFGDKRVHVQEVMEVYGFFFFFFFWDIMYSNRRRHAQVPFIHSFPTFYV